MFKHLRLSTRILLTGLLPVLCFTLVLPWLNIRVSTRIRATKVEKTRHLVESAWGVLDFFNREAVAGRMTTDQAQQRAREAISHLRYAGNDYFWINDLHPSMIMHPVNTALDGKDLSDYKDPNGLRLFVKMVEVCKRGGEGLVEYEWPKPGASKPQPKISYVKLFAPWGWIVGSGIYVDDVQRDLRSMLAYLIGAGLLVALVSLVCSLLIARSIANPIQGVVASLAEGAGQIAEASRQIAGSSQALAQGAAEQAASLEESAGNSARITTLTRNNAGRSREAAGNAAETVAAVADANQKLEALVACMRDIDSSGDKVIRIIKVIDEIAFQTNILALNASVEAARAGEAGMGFAVVADEVRNLARRSADAARDTTSLIQESVATSKNGSSQLEQVTAAVNRITGGASTIQRLVDEVYSASQEQASGIEQVSASIVQMERVTQGTAAASEQSASASQELSAQAMSLRTLVRRLEHLVRPSGRAESDD